MKTLSEETAINILQLVLEAAGVEGIYASVTLGNTFDTHVYIHDLRDGDNVACIFCTDKEICHHTKQNGIRYIHDPEFRAAEEYITKIINCGGKHE